MLAIPRKSLRFILPVFLAASQSHVRAEQSNLLLDAEAIEAAAEDEKAAKSGDRHDPLVQIAISGKVTIFKDDDKEKNANPKVVGKICSSERAYLLKLANGDLLPAITHFDGLDTQFRGKLRNNGKYLVVAEIPAATAAPWSMELRRFNVEPRQIGANKHANKKDKEPTLLELEAKEAADEDAKAGKVDPHSPLASFSTRGRIRLFSQVNPENPDVVGELIATDRKYLLKLASDTLLEQIERLKNQEALFIGKLRNNGKYFILVGHPNGRFAFVEHGK